MTYKDISYGEERRQAQYPLDSQDMMEEQSCIIEEEEVPPHSVEQEVSADICPDNRQQQLRQHQDLIGHYEVFFGQKLVSVKHSHQYDLNQCDNYFDKHVTQQKYEPLTPQGLRAFQQQTAQNSNRFSRNHWRTLKHYRETIDELIKLDAEYYELATTHPEKISQIEQSIRTNRLTEQQVQQRRRRKRYQYSHRKNLVLTMLESYHRFNEIPQYVVTRIYWILQEQTVSQSSLRQWMRLIHK